MTRKANAALPGSASAVIDIEKGEAEADTMARTMVGPFMRHGVVTNALSTKMAGKLPGDPQFDHFSHAIKTKAEKASAGDLTMASHMLAAQACTLDAIFTEMARRSVMNMGEYIAASETYMRLALKAQANSRATLDALAKLHQPREQTVRHVHVNEGGQAVIADEIHHHGGRAENAKSGNQSHATGAAGASAALQSPDPLGNGVPIASGEGEAALQDARGQ